MATYWADYVNGNDSNDGTSYAQAKKTWLAVLNVAEAAGKGHTVNIVAPSSGPMVIEDGGGWTGSSMSGTDYDSDPGLVLQGTDSSGNPALAYIEFQDTTTNVTALNLSTGADYFDIKGFVVNWEKYTTAEGGKIFINQSSTSSNGLRVRYCVALCDDQFGGQFLTQAVTSAETELAYCVFVYRGRATPLGGLISLDNRGVNYIHHNVMVVDGQITVNEFGFNNGSNMAANSHYRVEHNTFYLTSNFSEVGGNFLFGAMTDADAFSDPALITIKDNVYYCQVSKANMRFMQFSGTNDTWTIDIGYNHFFYVSGNGWDTDNPYENQCDPAGIAGNSNDLWANDSEQAADPFNDTASTWVWDFGGSSYSYTLEWDLRVVAPYRTISSTGGVPGAIPDAVETYIIGGSDVTLTADIGSAYIGEVAITNSGTGTLVISNIAYAAVSDSGGTLTYQSGSSDSISAGATAYYYVAFAPTTHPTTATGTLTFTSNDDQGNGTFVINITGKSVNLWLPGDGPATPIGPKSPATISPPNAKREERGVRVGMTLEKNTVFQWDFTTAVGGWSDNVTKLKTGRVVLATNTGLTAVGGLSLSGANKLMVQPQGGKSLIQAGSTTCLILDGGCLLLANVSNLTTFKMSNPDTLHTVTVHVYMSGGTLVKNDPRGKKSTANELSNPD